MMQRPQSAAMRRIAVICLGGLDGTSSPEVWRARQSLALGDLKAESRNIVPCRSPRTFRNQKWRWATAPLATSHEGKRLSVPLHGSPLFTPIGELRDVVLDLCDRDRLRQGRNPGIPRINVICGIPGYENNRHITRCKRVDYRID
jgi:hypothetical protein